MFKLFLAAFAKDNFARTRGVSTRREYWSFFAVLAVVSVALQIVAFTGSLYGSYLLYWIGTVTGVTWGLFCVVPCVAVTIRRFHDVGFSGWWVGVLLSAQVLLNIGMQTVTDHQGLAAMTAASVVLFLMWLMVLGRPSRFENNPYRRPEDPVSTLVRG